VALFPSRTDLEGLDPPRVRGPALAGPGLRAAAHRGGARRQTHNRVCRSADDARDTEPDPAFTPLSTVLNDLSDLTYQQTRLASELAYTHIAAYTVSSNDLRDPRQLGPDVPDHRMDTAKVSTDSSPDIDPLWEDVTLLLELVAEQTPFEIAHYLARTDTGSGSATV
jgi:hypothetical protein